MNSVTNTNTDVSVIYARRRRLAQALEAGEYRQHTGGWRSEDGSRVCVLGAAYLQMRKELELDCPGVTATALMHSVTRSVGDYYGLGFMACWRLIHLNDSHGWTLSQLGREIEAMPAPATPAVMRVIRGYLRLLAGRRTQPKAATA